MVTCVDILRYFDIYKDASVNFFDTSSLTALKKKAHPRVVNRATVRRDQLRREEGQAIVPRMRCPARV